MSDINNLRIKNYIHKFCMIFFMCFSVASCMAIKDVATAIDDAVAAIDQNSQEWQTALQQAILSLGTDVSDPLRNTVRTEMRNLLARGVAALGAEVRCETDFIGRRIKQALINIKEREVNGNAVETPPPYFCSVVPSAIELKFVPDNLELVEIFGFDFDVGNIRLAVRHFSGGETDVTDYLDMPTHYHMTVNLGVSGIQFTSNDQRLVFYHAPDNDPQNWQEMYTIAIVQNIQRVQSGVMGTVTFIPPWNGRGDREFDGNGPSVICSVRLQITSDGTQVQRIISMVATETRSNWTQASGSRVDVVYTAPRGKRIMQLIGDISDEVRYTDTDHEADEFYQGVTGPVQKFTFLGDADGEDAGLQTRVTLDLNRFWLDIF